MLSKKVVTWGVHWTDEHARPAHFCRVMQLALGVDRFRDALELPETWEIRGATGSGGVLPPVEGG